MDKKVPIRLLKCTCCGGQAKSRQWWNQDTGYGLCDNCIEFCRSREIDFDSTYGVEGFHFGISKDQG